MKQRPTGAPELCEVCRVRPATQQYTSARDNHMVCVFCLDQQAARDALENQLHHIAELEMRQEYDQVIACLDAIWVAHQHRDHDHWLARSIAMHKSSTLYDAGRYVEAEQALEIWARLGFADVSGRWLHSVIYAKTVEALARSEEAIAVLEDALGHSDPKYFPSVRMVLATLAEMSETLGRPVDPKWRHLAEELAAFHGVPLPAHESLGKTILELVEVTRVKQSRQSEHDH